MRDGDALCADRMTLVVPRAILGWMFSRMPRQGPAAPLYVDGNCASVGLHARAVQLAEPFEQLKTRYAVLSENRYLGSRQSLIHAELDFDTQSTSVAAAQSAQC